MARRHTSAVGSICASFAVVFPARASQSFSRGPGCTPPLCSACLPAWILPVKRPLPFLLRAGHSLGGAVATLCAIRLLDALPEALHHTVTCVGFAVPPVRARTGLHDWEARKVSLPVPHAVSRAAVVLGLSSKYCACQEGCTHLSLCPFCLMQVGNASLAAAVAAAGWSRRITNYLLPEDWVPGLLGMFARQQGGGGHGHSTPPSEDEAHERVCCGYATTFALPRAGAAAARPAGAAAAPAAAAAAAA